VSPIIRPETTADHPAIRDVNRTAFGGEGEAQLVDALRAGGYARVSLVADENGRVVGHILFSALVIATPQGSVEALSLAPMAVVPSHQRQGIGSKLAAAGLRACQEAGHRIVIVLGHPEFYPRFGFSAELAERLTAPFSGPAFMALVLVPGALDGVDGEVRYPPPFSDLTAPAGRP
jgi:putative acetyltransferase